MRANNRKPLNPYLTGQGTSGLIPLAMLAVGIPWGIWTLSTLLVSSDSRLATFNAMEGWFIVLAFAYLGLYGLKELAWCSVTVVLTIRALVEFIVVPAWLFVSGDDQVDFVYVHAIILTLVGFVAFWVGSLILMKRRQLRFVPQVGYTTNRVVFVSAAMLMVGVLSKWIMWKAGLLSFTAQIGAREALIAYMDLLVSLGNLLIAAMVISAIEVFAKGSKGFIKFLFWVSIAFSLGFGAISGMKSQMLLPLIVLVLVYGITKRRIPRAAFLLPLLLMVVYPFVNAYRVNLESGYRNEATTISGLRDVLWKSFVDVAFSHGSTSDQAKGALDMTTSRLSLLTYVHDIIELPAPSLLNGDERVWLAPVYPLIPRFLWKDKPVLNKGQRLSIALGRPDTTSSAVTPIGDLYTLYGTVGVVVGMFLYGIGLQSYMNWICRGVLSERGLFVYLSLIVPLINLENDVVSLVAGAIQIGIVAVVMSYVIYGRPIHSVHFGNYPRPIRAL